jgi:hypothetical protein
MENLKRGLAEACSPVPSYYDLGTLGQALDVRGISSPGWILLSTAKASRLNTTTKTTHHSNSKVLTRVFQFFPGT